MAMIDDADRQWLRGLLAEYVSAALARVRSTQVGISMLPGTATVVDDTVYPPIVTCAVDGDGQSVDAQSLVGIPAEGDRVMLVFAPPSAVFVLPFPPPPT